MENLKSPHFLSASEALRRIRAGRLSAADLVRACLNQIQQIEQGIKAWVALAPDPALERAQAIDKAIQEGKPLGPLAGIPIGIKDIFNTADMPTAMGSPLWTGYTPGNDARVVSVLREAGGIILGKTVTAEFAVHTPGPTVNPHHPEHSPGTSSSGSAAAVAAYMVPCALGSQTAGSAIRPASYCGIYGFKPSFGLIPRTGSLKTTDSLDTVAFFARSPEDMELLFEVLRVKGQDYPVSQSLLMEPGRQGPHGHPWRIGLVKGPKWDNAEEYSRQALLAFASTLASHKEIVIEEVTPPSEINEAHQVHEIIYNKALSYYFKQEFKKETLVSSILKAMIVRGQMIPLEEYKSALKRQARIAQALDQWLHDRFDLLLTLSTGGEAPRGLQSPDRPDSCLVWTLCGVPAVNVPVFRSPEGLPFGAQFVARRYGDYALLRFVRHLKSLGLAPNAVHPEPAGCVRPPTPAADPMMTATP